MSINLFFLSITIKKRKISIEEARHQEMVEKLIEHHKTRQFTNPRIYL